MAFFHDNDNYNVFDEENEIKEIYELMEETLDDITANAYGIFDKELMEYCQKTLDKIEKLKG